MEYSQNQTGRFGPGCQDSESYRNPANGYACSEHNGTTCVDWLGVLDEVELDELLESCPESCLALGCMNKADANLASPPVALTSFLDGNSSAAPTISASTAVWTTFGLMSLFFGFVISRHRSVEDDRLNADPSSDEPDSHPLHSDSLKELCSDESQYSIPCDGTSQEREDASEGIEIICNEIRGSNETPAGQRVIRWLPELNVSLESDSTESNVSVGQMIVPTPLNSAGVDEGSLRGSFEDSNSILSPSDSTTVVHLLGALRSYEEESDWSAHASP